MPHLKATHLLFLIVNVFFKILTGRKFYERIYCDRKHFVLMDIKQQANIITNALISAKFTSIKKESPLKCLSVLCYG